MALDKLTLPSKTVGESESEYGQKYKDALNKLTASLDAREGLNYNPTLLAISQGLLSPTATGSFGESLGNVAGSLLKSKESESKRGIENAQMRMQLAQAGMEQENRAKNFALEAGTYVPPGGVPKVGEVPIVGEVSKTGTTPSGFTPMNIISAIGRTDPERAKFLMAQNTAIQSLLEPKEGYVFNKATGEQIPISGSEAKPEFVPESGKSYMMSMKDRAAINTARDAGDVAAVYKIIDKLEKGVGPRPGSTEVIPSLSGIEQRKSEEAAAAAAATERAKTTEKTTQNKILAGQNASSLRVPAQTILDYSSNPDSKYVFGVLEKPGLMTALGSFIEKGARVGDWSIGLPGIRDAVQKISVQEMPKNPGETPDAYEARKQGLIDSLAMVGQAVSQLKITGSQSLKGEGPISDNERKMIEEAIATPNNTPGVLIMKSKVMLEKANFDEILSDKLNNSGMSYAKYSTTPEFKNDLKAYEARLRNIVHPGIARVSKPGSTGGAPTGGITADSLRALLQPRTR